MSDFEFLFFSVFPIVCYVVAVAALVFLLLPALPSGQARDKGDRP
jgi:hypothetical protein